MPLLLSQAPLCSEQPGQWYMTALVLSSITWDVDSLMIGSREKCPLCVEIFLEMNPLSGYGVRFSCFPVFIIHFFSQVLVTVPLALLQKGAIHFNPPLSEKKMKAINSLGAGIIEKVTGYSSRVTGVP